MKTHSKNIHEQYGCVTDHTDIFLSNNSSFEIQLRIVHLVLMKIKNKHYSGTLMLLIFELGH